jgi:predicted nucleic acid-binding protein
MPEVFFDTSGWANLFVRSQPYHQMAQAFVRRWRVQKTRAVTTDYVLAEFVALLSRPLRLTRPRQIILLTAIQSSTWVEIVHIDTVLDGEAWSLWRSRPDKEWSLVDCASFVVMQRRGLTEALTTDHHFEQAGFVRLLK